MYSKRVRPSLSGQRNILCVRKESHPKISKYQLEFQRLFLAHHFLSFFFFLWESVKPLGERRLREWGRGWGCGERGVVGGKGIWRVSGQRYLIDGLFKQTATHTPPCGTVPRSPRLQHGACSAGRNTKGEPGGESDGRGNTYLDRISKPPL